MKRLTPKDRLTAILIGLTLGAAVAAVFYGTFRLIMDALNG